MASISSPLELEFLSQIASPVAASSLEGRQSRLGWFSRASQLKTIGRMESIHDQAGSNAVWWCISERRQRTV
jgi:hypothetical protein